jgi:hypothetical protein
MTRIIEIPTPATFLFDEGGNLMYVSDLAAHHADYFIKGETDTLALAQMDIIYN